ncbi:MAG: DUF3592 domain-containing protein [Magnetococcales bacterium]|nr:DUF3592 domain-containing protein [Magnetococcales bacterium]
MGYKFYLLLRNLSVVLSVTFFIFAAHPVIQHNKTSDWPSVKGNIILSQLVKKKPLFLNIGGVYHTEIHFLYRVDGKPYVGTRIQYGIGVNSFLFEQFAQKVVERYPKDKMVTVFYNPVNPSDEIVERSPALGFTLVWITSAVLFFGLAIVISIRQKEIQSAIDQPLNVSLRPSEQERDDIIQDYYPTPVYNPSPSAQEEGRQAGRDLEQLKQLAKESGQQKVTLTTDEMNKILEAGYPSAIYAPTNSGNTHQEKTLTLALPSLPWQLTLTLKKKPQ